MFQQTAYNDANMGFYPTDERTLACIQRALLPREGCTIVDPCCGEGAALAALGHYCQGRTVGIELDTERAEKASAICDQVLTADLQDCHFPDRAAEVLFLNPPYRNAGQGLTDQRLEQVFIRKTLPCVALGGVVVLVLPRYIIPKVAPYLVRHLEDILVGHSPEQRFKQVILIGRKIASHCASKVVSRAKAIVTTVENETPFPCDIANPFSIGEPSGTPFQARTVTASQADILALADTNSTLWHTLPAMFDGGLSHNVNTPLMPLSDWHLSLALSAGQISGLMDNGQQQLLVKGSTEKVKEEIVEERDDIKFITIVDKFKAVIKALDVGHDSPTFGELITIQ